MTPKLRAGLIVMAVVLPLDQLTKAWVASNVSPFRPLVVIEGFFSITYARNPGMALGLFPEVPVLVFVAFTLVALALLVHFYRQLPAGDVLSATALGSVTGGALGNLCDRVMRGEVVDFLQFDLGLFVWPDFNVADAAIVCGVILLMVDVVASDAEGGVSEET